MRLHVTCSRLLCCLCFFTATLSLSGQDEIPTVFSDKIFKGSGIINMLNDVSPGTLDSYFSSSGRLALGVDVNEANAGNESSRSLGVAISQVELMITTTAGDFSFTDFYTNTTALIQDSSTGLTGSYYTLFGTGGSSSLNSGTRDFDPSALDDVLYLDDIFYEGDLLAASLRIELLTTDPRTGANEEFFDFSGGFEDFAIIGAEDASVTEAQASGLAGASPEIAFSVNLLSSPESLPAAPGAPLPGWFAFAGLAALLVLIRRRYASDN